MVLGHFPKAVAVAILLIFSAGISHAQQDKKQTARDNRSDSQKSYIAPRTNDANRKAGGNTAASKQSRSLKATGTADKKPAIRK